MGTSVPDGFGFLWSYNSYQVGKLEVSGGPMLKEGSKAPDVEVNDDHGNLWRLSDHVGKKLVVLFFYPKANTPG